MRKRTVSNKRNKNKKGLQHYEIIGLLLVVIGTLAVLSIAGQNIGFIGECIFNLFSFLFGKSAGIPAIVFIFVGIRYIALREKFKYSLKFFIGIILYWLLIAAIHAWFTSFGNELNFEMLISYGGALGGIAVWGLRFLFGEIGTWIVLFVAVLITIVFFTKWSLSSGVIYVGEKTTQKVAKVGEAIKAKKIEYEERHRLTKKSKSTYSMRDFIFKKKQDKLSLNAEPVKESDYYEESHNNSEDLSQDNEKFDCMSHSEVENIELPSVFVEIDDTNVKNSEDLMISSLQVEGNPINAIEELNSYQYPPLTLLQPGVKQSYSLAKEASDKKKILEDTLHNFGVAAKVINISVGPTVTRFELEPAPGVKVKKIENLSDDIALQLAATHVRIEAPIPGKSAVGIEVPNGKNSVVVLRDVLESQEFIEARGNINVALGKDIAGKTIVADLAKMPHLLIAGSTGSGKSVCINTIIMSILYKYSPEEVKMILIDPKVVELSIYNKIPHLRSPVVTEPKKSAGALQWAVKEMENRYKLFSESGVRDIRGYNRLHTEDKMSFLLIVIDELADLMMVAADSVEQSICRLAQKARAAGIHLILATQRPSVDVITGLIKANIPSRISFAVSSQIDSRTILDKSGAEHLLGKGDMLFAPIGVINPIRIQGAFVSDEEVEAVTNFVENQKVVAEMIKSQEPIVFTAPEEATKVVGEEQQDELLSEAVDWVLSTGRASVSMLQRRFRIGYTRAGRLMDTMEELGIVGTANGAKPRDILVSKEQAEQILKGD
ncbi:MAG: DNA translocase FtsK 4TM domain-containing protein [Dialister pneumosintes]